MERKLSQAEYTITNPDNHEAFRIMTEQGKNPKRVVERVIKDTENGKIISKVSIAPYYLIDEGKIDILIMFLDDLQRQSPDRITELIISSD